jgi:site-specific recombinase XerD
LAGLRRSELANIEFGDYHRARDTILIKGKGNKEREAHFTDNGASHLCKWINEFRGTGEGAMFARIRKGEEQSDFTVTVEQNGVYKTVPKFLSSQAIYYILDKKQKELGLESFSLHDLRRTLATKLLSDGEDLITVRDILGHASLNTTQKYDMRSRDRLKEAAQRSGF